MTPGHHTASNPGEDALRRAGDASVLILTSLAEGPKHGYALIQDVMSFSGVRLGRARCTAPWTAWSTSGSSKRFLARTGATLTA